MRGRMRAVVAAALLALPGTAAARPFPGAEYSGRTAAGDPVHFVLTSDRRIAAFTAGSIPGSCPDGSRTSFLGQFPYLATRVRRGGRFVSSADEVDTGTYGSYDGRLLAGGRARGSVGASDRGDCGGSTTWTARAGAPTPRRLAGGPALSGPRLAWVERAGSVLRVLRGGRLVRRLALARGFDAQRFVSLAASGRALTAERELTGDEGSEIFAGPPGGPLRILRGPGCNSHADADGALVVAAFPDDPCGYFGGQHWRVVLRDVAHGTTRTLFDDGGDYPGHGPELPRLAGRWIAWVDQGQIVVWDRTLPRGPLNVSPAGAYRVPADGVVAFDLDADGTLVVVRPTIHFADDGAYAVDAFWPSDPHAHRIGIAATPAVRVAAGRTAFVEWEYFTGPAEDPLVVGRTRASGGVPVALFPARGAYRVRRTGGFDLDAHRVAWAEQVSVTVRRRTTRGPVRLVASSLPR